MSLDIETSKAEDYTWISSIQVYFLGQYHLFRKPLEFIYYLKDLIGSYNLYKYKRLMIIIHNASYDLSYLIGYFQKYLPDKDDRTVIKRDRNNTICYRQGGLEFRDTYALTNKSLEKWGKDLNIEHAKKVGFYDYDKIIYQDTLLTDKELEYDQYDVLSLHECFNAQLLLHKDTIATVPYTSTGYVRRDCERICQLEKHYRDNYFKATKLDLEQFEMCIRSFAGGYTHNNRFYNDVIVRKHIKHRDFRSMYPSELRCYPLPFGKPRIIYDVTNRLRCKRKITTNDILNLYPAYSSIIEIEIESAILKDKKITMPFMQASKMNITKMNHCLKDNGRVLSFNGRAVICVDNFMFKILTEQYKMKYRIIKVLTFKNEYIPACLKNLIDRYFKNKSDLKILAESCYEKYGEFDTRTIEAMQNLMINKQLLNGIYGMFVQNPLSNEYDIDYDNFDFIYQELVNSLTPEAKEDKLNDFYNNRKKFLPYQVGVFVTALARYELYEYITVIGYENCLYCDTDSIFYISTPEIEQKIESLNKKKQENAEKIGAYIISNNKKIYYDHFSAEPDLKAFKGLHAKCYGYVTESNEFKCTIAGVPARTIIGMKEDKPVYMTRENELMEITKDDIINNTYKLDNEKALQNLTENFIFKVNTGTTCNYQQYMLHNDIEIDINGHTIQTFGGALISKLESKKIKNMDLDDIMVFKKEGIEIT